MSSPVTELLVQEGLCTELFKTISESVGASSASDPELVHSTGLSGDVIGQLIDRMIQILPPEERDIFGTSDEKNIEDIIQEANELIRSTTPLFSFSDSGEKSWNTSKGLMAGSVAKDASKKASGDVKQKSRSDSTCSSIQSNLANDVSVDDGSVRQDSPLLEPEELLNGSGQEKSIHETPVSDPELSPIAAESLSMKAKSLDISSNKMREKLKEIDKSVSSAKENLKIYSEQSNLSVSDPGQSMGEHESEENKENIVNERPEAEMKLISLQQKHIAEIQELTQAHKKETSELREQINRLTDQIYELKKQLQIEKSPDSKEKQLELLEKELKSQEQLLTGYERENKKLCKEIITMKESWKQQQSALVEEKQRLQGELKGMVSRSTTQTLEEQLKDARETIVRHQMELTEYKRKNRELENLCERLRSDCQHLQTELSNCRCRQWAARGGSQADQFNSSGSRERVGSVGADMLAAAVERQASKELAKEKELLFKENLDLKRQVRELESIVRRRQRSEGVFPAPAPVPSARLTQLEQELSARQESLNTLHAQFVSMQKKYEENTKDLMDKLKQSKDELQTVKASLRKEEAKSKKSKQGPAPVKEETHLLATIRGLRQELSGRDKEITKLNKDIEEVRQTNRRLQKEREKHLNSLPNKTLANRDKANLRKDKPGSRINLTSSNNNVNSLLLTELQESNLLLSSQTKTLQEEVKRLEQDLIVMHKKRLHDLKVLQSEHELEVSRLVEERASFLSQHSATELQGQIYTQQMVINHLKNRLKQMEQLKGEVTLLRAERDHLEQSLAAVNHNMALLQNAQSPEGIQYKTLLAKLESLEKSQEVREQKLNAVRELLSRSTQSQATCGSCRDKLLDKNRQICYYRAQMDRILEALVDVRRTK